MKLKQWFVLLLAQIRHVHRVPSGTEHFSGKIMRTIVSSQVGRKLGLRFEQLIKMKAGKKMGGEKFTCCVFSLYLQKHFLRSGHGSVVQYYYNVLFQLVMGKYYSKGRKCRRERRGKGNKIKYCTLLSFRYDPRVNECNSRNKCMQSISSHNFGTHFLLALRTSEYSIYSSQEGKKKVISALYTPGINIFLITSDLFPMPLIVCYALTMINCRQLTKGSDHKQKFEILGSFFLWRIDALLS